MTVFSADTGTCACLLNLTPSSFIQELIDIDRIYISGDTLFIPELEEIPKRYPQVDLMLVHLGGTTIPSPSVPLLMVTMDAKQGVQLVQLIGPDLTLPIHYE